MAIRSAASLLIRTFVPTLRIKTVARISLNRALIPCLRRLRGETVLDVGANDSPYRKHLQCDRYVRLDIDGNSHPDITADLHDTGLAPDSYDCIIATEVLEHLCNPQKAIDEMRRLLKPGGSCVLSTRFFYVYHPCPRDYYRFTRDSLQYLFRDFATVEIVHHGNLLQAVWQLLNDRPLTAAVCNIFNPLIARIHFASTRYPLGFVVYARK